jgi:hypothetical protein
MTSPAAVDRLFEAHLTVADLDVSINASPRATHAHASLRETPTTMSGGVIGEASVSIPLEGSTWDANVIAQDAHLSGLLRSALAALACFTRTARTL